MQIVPRGKLLSVTKTFSFYFLVDNTESVHAVRSDIRRAHVNPYGTINTPTTDNTKSDGTV